MGIFLTFLGSWYFPGICDIHGIVPRLGPPVSTDCRTGPEGPLMESLGSASFLDGRDFLEVSPSARLWKSQCGTCMEYSVRYMHGVLSAVHEDIRTSHCAVHEDIRIPHCAVLHDILE